MLGKRLDNIHPYGIRVDGAGRGTASPAIRSAGLEASRKADRLLDELTAPPRRKSAGRSRKS
mgnify:CR=1 FL=1